MPNMQWLNSAARNGDQDQVFPQSIWLKKVLVPFWVVQLALPVLLFVIACLMLSTATSLYFDSTFQDYGYYKTRYS